MSERLSVAEAVAKLDAISPAIGIVQASHEVNEVLLAAVDPAVSDAWRRAAVRVANAAAVGIGNDDRLAKVADLLDGERP